MSDLYRHWFVVTDLDHRPGKAEVVAVHQVLHRWGVVAEQPVLLDATGLTRRPIPNDDVARGAALPDDLVLAYPAASGPRVAQLLGKGPAGPIEYVEATACFSTRYRLLESFATLEAQVADGGVEDRFECPVTQLRRFGEGADAAPPSVELTVRDPRTGEPLPTPAGFKGVFRAGVCLQPGWVPDWVCGLPRERARWPDRRFALELEEAIGSPLVQVGLIV